MSKAEPAKVGFNVCPNHAELACSIENVSVESNGAAVSACDSGKEDGTTDQPLPGLAMEDSMCSDGFNGTRRIAPAPLLTQEADELTKLRDLVLQDDLRLLRELRLFIENPNERAQWISGVIAEAVFLRGNQDDRLQKALQPAVEDIFRISVKTNPEELANTIFPLMGPAIRKAISEGFRGMLDGLHKTLEMAFSWRGVKWRIEAFRTGKSFSEVVLLHTLLYQVEQVFLIHSQSGLLLGHVVADGIEFQDADLVSGMLTAIQDFVKDCFISGDSSLDTLQMGERTLLVEKGSRASLALLVHGTLPLEFRNKIRDSLDIIHIEGARAFEGFSGDIAPFSILRRHLEACLEGRYVDPQKVMPRWVKWTTSLVACIAMVIPLYLWGQEWRFQKKVAVYEQRFQKAVGTLEKSPGIVVSSAQGRFDHGWTIALARDPLAADPHQVLRDAGFDPTQVSIHETPFASLEPEMVTTRLKQAMEAPKSARLSFADGVLYLEGSAPLQWILATTEKALAVPGVERVDSSKIHDPRTIHLTALVRQVEAAQIQFPLGKDSPEGPDLQKLHDTVSALATLAQLAKEMGLSPTLIIYGHTDSSGSDKRNYELSESRAKTLASMLYARGVPMPIATYGFGSQYAVGGDKPVEALKQLSRRLDLKVHFSYLGNSLLTF